MVIERLLQLIDVMQIRQRRGVAGFGGIHGVVPSGSRVTQASTPPIVTVEPRSMVADRSQAPNQGNAAPFTPRRCSTPG